MRRARPVTRVLAAACLVLVGLVGVGGALLSGLHRRVPEQRAERVLDARLLATLPTSTDDVLELWE